MSVEPVGQMAAAYVVSILWCPARQEENSERAEGRGPRFDRSIPSEDSDPGQVLSLGKSHEVGW